MPNDPLIEEYVRDFSEKWHALDIPNGCKAHMQSVLRTSLKEYGDKRVAGIEKAYGGCKECYGKGYFTEQQGKIGSGRITLRGPAIVMNYCKNCERGKQLKSLITQKQ